MARKTFMSRSKSHGAALLLSLWALFLTYRRIITNFSSPAPMYPLVTSLQWGQLLRNIQLTVSHSVLLTRQLCKKERTLETIYILHKRKVIILSELVIDTAQPSVDANTNPDASLPQSSMFSAESHGSVRIARSPEEKCQGIPAGQEPGLAQPHHENLGPATYNARPDRRRRTIN